MQDKLITKKTSLNYGGNLEDINGVQIMGILNLTPDSFYDGGKNNAIELSINNVKKMLADGANIIDIGGYSSRPGAEHISEQQEIDRLLPTLTRLVGEIPGIKISVDTFRSRVAKAAVNAGALLVNDISGGDLDPEMFATVAKLNVPYIAMHMKGTPQNMQNNPSYRNILEEVLFDLSLKKQNMIQAGIKDIIFDPGFGFGKTLDHNYQLLQNLQAFEILGAPILVGVSRKSMVYKPYGGNAKQALNGTTAVHMLALERGAQILRVHDVKEAHEAITIWEKLKNTSI